jgi:hypothetical protein
VGIQRKRVNWVLDADIRGFFDNLSHEWTMMSSGGSPLTTGKRGERENQRPSPSWAPGHFVSINCLWKWSLAK